MASEQLQDIHKCFLCLEKCVKPSHHCICSTCLTRTVHNVLDSSITPFPHVDQKRFLEAAATKEAAGKHRDVIIHKVAETVSDIQNQKDAGTKQTMAEFDEMETNLEHSAQEASSGTKTVILLVIL